MTPENLDVPGVAVDRVALFHGVVVDRAALLQHPGIGGRSQETASMIDLLRRPESSGPVGILTRPDFRQASDSLRFVLRKGDLLPGNRIDLLRDGAVAYPRMLEAISGARRFILLETYLFSDDFVGLRFARALAAKAREGVDVRILYDSLGSKATPRDFFGWMRSQGIRAQAFHPIRPFLNGLRFRNRNHRKVLMVDGRTAFVGGLNLSREYAAIEAGGDGWRDTEIEINGPAAGELARLSLDDWPKEWSRHPAPGIHIVPPPAELNGSPVLILGSSRLRDRFRISKNLRFAFRQARQRIWIANPYFLPSRAIREDLRRARQRGVDVRLLVPRASDVPPALYASQRLFERYLRWGIRIFEWPGPMMHAKAAVIDTQWSTVGSYNMDPLSQLLNAELTAVILNRDFGGRLEAMFREDFGVSRELTLDAWKSRGWLRRLTEKACYLFRLIL
jgi:cardiolipin synthase